MRLVYTVQILLLPVLLAAAQTQFIGQIQTYKPGDVLTIRVLQRRELKFDLTKKDTVYQISPGLHQGSHVTVEEHDLSDGRHEVIVKPEEKGK